MEPPPTATVDLYQQLPAAKTKLKLTAADPFTPQYVISVVNKKNQEDVYTTRVQGRTLLLENTGKHQSHVRKEREEKKERVKAAKERKKLGVLGRRQGTGRERGLWGFDESQARFELFLPLHHLWMGYMSELLGLPRPGSGAPRAPSGAAVHPKLLKADFHGSIMTVYQSKNTATIGLWGIVIHETEATFKVVTKENKLKVIPKRNSIFKFAVPAFSTLPATHDPSAPLPLPVPVLPSQDLRTVLDGPHALFELHGNQFCFRSADRAGKKFKAKETIEL